MNSKQDLSFISKYRLFLMGIATIDIMVGHFLSWTGLEPFPGIIGYVIMSILTPVHSQGFLLLSGLGLYYSFSRNSNIPAFYKRRLQRVFLPFIVMTIPLYAIVACQESEVSILQYLGWITSIGYWFGDTNFWYIAMSLVLYAIFPFVYKWMILQEKRICLKTVVLAILTILLSLALSIGCPEYFDKIRLSIPKAPIFFVGIYYGYLISKETKINIWKYLAIYFCTAMLFFVLSRYDTLFFNYVDISVFLITIPSVCIIVELFQNTGIIKLMTKIWSWTGRYSLELYVLHLMMRLIISNLNIFSPIPSAILAIGLAIVLCIPANKLATTVTKCILK